MTKLNTTLLKDLPIKQTSITDDDYVVVSSGGTKKLKIKDITKDVEKKAADLEEKTTELSEQLDNIKLGKSIGVINGKLFLPSDFPTIPFDIYFIDNKFRCNLSAKTLTKTDATKVYISCLKGGSGLGETPSNAISLARFSLNLSSSLYSNVTDFELIFVDKIYIGNEDEFKLENQAINITFRSGVGFTWFGRVKSKSKSTLSDWVLTDDIYKATLDSSGQISDVVNLTKLNEFEMPYIYENVSSLEECKSKEGSFYQNGTEIYCNPYSFHDATKSVCVTATKCLHIRQYKANKCVFENIGFLCDSLYYATDSINNKTYFIDCKFHRGLTNSFSAVGKYSVYLYNCIADYGSADNFNYHTYDYNSVVVEINCIAYGAGYFKISGGNTATASNNCSTAHEGLNILRLGCKYWDSEGPTVADINNCYSININCEAKNCKETNTGYKTSFLFQNTGTTGRTTQANKYLINCKGGGNNVKYGIVGTDDTYINNFNGNINFKNEESVNEIKIIEWEGEIHE